MIALVAPFVASISASFIGSLHCSAMCGGIAFGVSKNKGSAILYHLARLTAYLFLATFVGLLGQTLFSRFQLFGFLILITLWGIGIWSAKSGHFPRLSMLWKHTLSQNSSILTRGLVTGLLTGFLPCHWLHVFLFMAAGTGSLVGAWAVIFGFWLGGLPSFLGVHYLSKGLWNEFTRFGAKYSRFLAITSISLGLAISLYQRFQPHTHHDSESTSAQQHHHH